MNEQDKTERMIDPRIFSQMESLADEPMPAHLHNRIMKRVFLAGYGKYLLFSASILVLNLGVLGVDLYRSFTTSNATNALRALRQSFSATPAYFASSASAIYGILPLQSIIATALTIALSVYIATVFAKIYRSPHGIKIM